MNHKPPLQTTRGREPPRGRGRPQGPRPGPSQARRGAHQGGIHRTTDPPYTVRSELAEGGEAEYSGGKPENGKTGLRNKGKITRESGLFPGGAEVFSTDYLRRTTCDKSTREAIFEHYPEARENRLLFRYIVWAFWGAWIDRDTHRLIISQGVLEWIGGRPLDNGYYGRHVLAEIQELVPDFRWNEWIPEEKCRTIERDGLDQVLYSVVRRDIRTPTEEYGERVYLLTGRPYSPKKGTRGRQETEEEVIALRDQAPSETARFAFDVMNSLSVRTQGRMKKHIPAAIRYVEGMDLGEKGEEARRYYLAVLQAIQDQPKQFYQFSGKGRTDRIFAYNPGAACLPKGARKILCQDFTEVDLRSAHLLIAASLWGAEEAVERLKAPDYCIWKDLIGHFDQGILEPSSDRYEKIKGALKVSLYSAIYGMPEPNIKGEFTQKTKEVLGPEAGQKLTEHWLIRDLLDAREEIFEDIALAGGMRAADGRFIELNASGGIDEESVLSTVAQSYEQELMKAILEYFEECEENKHKGDFRPVLWLHDGAYLSFTRRRKTHERELKKRLALRADELGVPAFFDIGPIEPPEIPEPTDHAPEETQEGQPEEGERGNAGEGPEQPDMRDLRRADTRRSLLQSLGASSPDVRRGRLILPNRPEEGRSPPAENDGNTGNKSLYRLIRTTVKTPEGRGEVLQVFKHRITVQVGDRAIRYKPSEIVVPD